MNLAQLGDGTGREVAEEFGISANSVRRWVKQSELDQGLRQDSLSTSKCKDLAKLRDEVRRLRIDQEILARVAA